MEILKAQQCFERIDGGGIRFIYTQVLFRRDGLIFCAKHPQRRIGPGGLAAEEFKDITAIHPEAYRPILPSGCTVAPPESISGCYVKQPNLIAYGVSGDLASYVLQELATCEIIRKNPHPNLAFYYGCVVSDDGGRVAGLCFKRYSVDLMQKLNPGHLNKSAFVTSDDRAAARKTASTRYLPGIEAGIRELHALGIVHNDLNPANVMITEDDTPVIIDFDSSTPPGVALDKTRRTHGWFDPDVHVSRENNDLDALAELRVWLTGSSSEEFRFKE
ncbi:hypothetical protein DL546_006921 [Coniochaeta pulveracea]|uniref:Protein kinase domain-containing protein n=1 Tax=Coniochaeta pulveracea TaxID=177199 RepID=A0A420YEE6_9PEZI|nr:hypothetical protein DL546_006921 [Coniochaeta pulveracea]